MNEAELITAMNALKDIARGKANNGVEYPAPVLRTIAADALQEISYMQYAQRRDKSE